MTAYVPKGRLIYISKAPAPTGVAITAATKAAPCVLTVTNSAAVGDYVRVEGTGFANLDGRAFKVSVATGTALTLEGSDTTDETATISTDGKAFIYEAAELVETCFSAFSFVREAATTITAGTFCGVTTLTGNPGAQTIDFSGFDDPESEGMKELMKAQDDGQPRLIVYHYPPAASASGDSYNMIMPAVTIAGFTGPVLAADGAATFTGTGTSNGKPTYSFMP